MRNRRPNRIVVLALAGLVAAGVSVLRPAPAAAQYDPDRQVDVELVLAVDVSRSMDYDERLIQRNGYAAAFRHPDVIQAIRSGLTGRIAVTYFEWAGSSRGRVIAPWTIISSAEEAAAFADMLGEIAPGLERGTSISGALAFSLDLFRESPADGIRRVIDVSGDGPNNAGGRVDVMRDRVLAEGITINGLPILIKPPNAFGFFDIPDLDVYYEDCVIGGPGAFMVTVDDVTQFEIAIRRKLVLEIAGLPARLIPAQLATRPTADCLAGEKARARRLERFDP